MRIKCNFCERTTTQGVGERSGFGHIKGRIGKGKSKRELNIYSCPDHSDEASKALEDFLTMGGMAKAKGSPLGQK